MKIALLLTVLLAISIPASHAGNKHQAKEKSITPRKFPMNSIEKTQSNCTESNDKAFGRTNGSATCAGSTSEQNPCSFKQFKLDVKESEPFMPPVQTKDNDKTNLNKDNNGASEHSQQL